MKPAPERSWSLASTLLARAWNARRMRCSRDSASASPEASSAQRISVVVMERGSTGRGEKRPTPERGGREQERSRLTAIFALNQYALFLPGI